MINFTIELHHQADACISLGNTGDDGLEARGDVLGNYLDDGGMMHFISPLWMC